VVCLAGAVKNTVKGIRDAKAAKGMLEEVPTEVPKIEEPNLAEIEKQADLEGEFYEDIFESQRADTPEYEDYLSDLAEAQNDYVKPAGGKSDSTSTKRPSWRQSEIDAAKNHPDYTEQKSFINGKEVRFRK
jgi:MoaA/NifB/PqqE/SkfB family radical SAM enzyme